MKKLLFILGLVLFSCGRKDTQIEDLIMNEEWEFKMISSGNNMPSFNPTNDSIHFIPILLNEGFELKEIKAHFDWTDQNFDTKMDILLKSEFLKKDEYGIVNPNVLIFTIEDGAAIRKSILPVAEEISESIKDRYTSILSRTKEIECLKSLDFKDISLFILSNVLLDDGQIENVELEYLQAKRPFRGGKRYYASYLAKKKESRLESFGIYGNQIESHDGYAICRYGNQRKLPEVLQTNQRLKNQYQNSEMRTRLNIPVITPDCNTEILSIADGFKPELLRLLKKHDRLMKDGYSDFGFDKRVSYEEYFIWMYHILYTEVTDNLIEEGLITLPDTKVSFYILEF